MTDSATLWLAIIAICSLVQTLLVLTVLAVAWHKWRKTVEAMDNFREVHLAPTIAKVDRVADELMAAIDRLRQVDDQVRGALSGAGHAVTEIGRHVRNRAWPVFGAIGALRAAASTLAPRKHSSPPRQQPEDREDEARFVYEGGTQYAR